MKKMFIVTGLVILIVTVYYFVFVSKIVCDIPFSPFIRDARDEELLKESPGPFFICRTLFEKIFYEKPVFLN
jgi:hypothetical protein